MCNEKYLKPKESWGFPGNKTIGSNWKRWKFQKITCQNYFSMCRHFSKKKIAQYLISTDNMKRLTLLPKLNVPFSCDLEEWSHKPVFENKPPNLQILSHTQAKYYLNRTTVSKCTYGKHSHIKGFGKSADSVVCLLNKLFFKMKCQTCLHDLWKTWWAYVITNRSHWGIFRPVQSPRPFNSSYQSNHILVTYDIDVIVLMCNIIIPPNFTLCHKEKIIIIIQLKSFRTYMRTPNIYYELSQL